MAPLNPNTKSVLVVDDFANVRKSIRAQLLDLGIGTVIEAYDAVSATKTLSDYHYHLILCDFNLGPGKDGLRLLEEWRKTKAIELDTVFVLITAETSRDIVVSATEFKPDDYLAKPFSMEVLSNRLTRWFERRTVLLPLLQAVDLEDWPTVNHQARQIMENHPRYRSSAQKYFSMSLIQQGQLMEAEHFLHGLIDKRYLSWAQTAIHNIEILQKKYESASEGLKEALNRDPNLIEAYDLLVVALHALGKHEEVQHWLEVCVSRSPRNIQRQESLAITAQVNEDYHRSSIAFRDVMQMSANTMHESINTYQQYLNNLQLEHGATDSEHRQREIRREINSASRKMTDRYHNDPNARLYAQAVAMTEKDDLNNAKYDKTLSDFFTSVFEAADKLNGETAILCIQQFYGAERMNDGDELVKHFCQRFADQPDIVIKLQDLQAEPVSNEDRNKAKTLNMKGIELYKNKEYLKSIRYFQEAMLLSPRHPGIILNFVQSHLVQMREQGVNERDIDTCLEYLGRLSYLPENHYQFQRCQKLKQTLEKMK